MPDSRGERSPERGSRRETRLLLGVFVGVLLLTALAGLWNRRTVIAAQQDVGALATHAERSMVLVGRVGRRVAQLRVTALQVLVRPAEAEEGDMHELERLDRHLGADLEELGQMLTEPARARWEQLLPRIERQRDVLRLALVHLLVGEVAEAQALLLELETDARELQQGIAELAEFHERESDRLLAAADARLQGVARAMASQTGLLLAALALVFWFVGRILMLRREQLDRHVEHIEQANSDLDAFAGRIAHDLRGVIAPISTAARLLVQDPDRSTVREAASRLARSSQRAGRMLDGLLAFSRTGSDPVGGSADLGAVVEDVLADLAPLAQGVGATVETDLVRCEVGLSPDLLGLLLNNLVGNALKFLEHRPTRRVRLVSRLEEREVVIEVEDTGPGIAARELERIFRPFYRAPGTQAPGTGIGLATVRRVASAHGGKVHAESTSGHGSRFILRLPLGEVSEPEPPRRGTLPGDPAEAWSRAAGEARPPP